MKTLLVLRHAKSSWNNVYLTDHDRPLNERGKYDAPRMGRLLRREELTPDLMLSSSAKRALSTAELVAEACGYENEILVRRDLYHAAPEDYVEALHASGGSHSIVMVVAHNPGAEEIVELLTDEYERMPTAGLAYISLPLGAWTELSLDTAGKLENFWRPKELRS